jgi:acetyltransferase-like isoleucine patch superfamily enzyme
MTTRKRGARFEDPLKLIPRILVKFYSIWVSATYPFASKGRNLSIHYTCNLPRTLAHRIKLGNSVQLKKDTWINTSFTTDENAEPALVIDDNSEINSRCHIAAHNYIHIERDVDLSEGVLITDQNHAYEDITAPVREQGATEGGRIRIGQGSWIGQGAAVVCSKGELVLGRNCVVGANAVVTRSFPPYSVISGNPARVVKQFDPVKQAWVMGSVRSSEAELVK